jgi:hypothetical protein
MSLGGADLPPVAFGSKRYTVEEYYVATVRRERTAARLRKPKPAPLEPYRACYGLLTVTALKPVWEGMAGDVR